MMSRILCNRMKYTLLLLLTLLCKIAYPQTPGSIVKGTVTSSAGALPGVSIYVKNNPRAATTTDENGQYSFVVPENATLVFSFIGYKNQVINVGSKTLINVVMQSEDKALGEVVVVGYGKQKAPTVTGAISTVAGGELVSTPVSNITNMLIGRAAGISGIQSSGEPGQNAATIRIRGIATLNGQDPLIVIDGVQQPAEQPYVVLNAMDANEIESISILKDASATAVYGIRGANGVIIVTTKRGKTNRPKFSFSANEGYTKATSLLPILGSYEYALFRNEGVYNARAAGNTSFDNLLFTDDELWKFKNNRDYTTQEVDAMSITADQKNALKNSPALYYTSHNYFKETFAGQGKQQQYNLNVSGGSSKVKYFTSLGYYHQQGILANTSYGDANTNSDFHRYNFRSNFDIDVFHNFQISVNLAGQSSISRFPSGGYGPDDIGDRYQNIIQGIFESSPFVGPGIVDGHLVNGFIGTSGDGINPLVGKGGSGISPFTSLLSSSVVTQYLTTLTSTVTLKHQMDYLTDGLNANARIAYDDSYTKGFYEQKSIPQYKAMRDPANPANILFTGGQLSPNSTSDNWGNGAWRKVYVEASIDYQHSFGNHNVSALVLGNAQKYTANGMSFNTPSGLMGLVGRATYNFKERYLVEFSMGLNGTENFAPAKRFGYFPAVSAGWVVSKEPLFPENKWVTWIKLRGSYGEVGNDQMNNRRYLYLPNSWAYSGYGYYFGNSNGSSANPYYSGATETALGNQEITWERAKKLNLAADLRFIKDKLSITGSLFKEKRNNILVTLQTIPATYGVPSSSVPPSNLGRVTNQGYEIELGWNDNIGKVSYFVKSNFSYAKNKIEYMAEPPYAYPWMNQTGYSIGQYKGYVTDGFYNTQKELNNRPYNTNGNNARLGDVRYKDINGDGIIDNKDQVPIGYSNLPRIAFNLSVGFSYKGFDVSALFIGTAQGSFPQSGYILSTPYAKNVGAVFQPYYDGHWTAEKYAKGEKITYPEFSFAGSGPNNLFSDFWLKSNDFKRLKNLEIGYSVQNRRFLTKTHISGIRIYANGNNLITWSKQVMKGIDPELADDGKSSMGYIYPLTKTFNFGTNIQF
ncbi:SusC/RagA family TonB-linked outer membrane protein [Chitinophaga oryziterrae]|uniref:SusC/RagA family TonB-linked outer membrane protein n=2 Tax=Chitinophaga oryziterrae TaxID=1031224 RepID=A0A6N8JI66_9BACT|nr:SusC/RagA family TonB-linked outer membrane protein [Chitinophaga oryziterrae]